MSTAKKNKVTVDETKSYSNLVQIAAGDFSEGMLVDTELYVKLGANYVLLCSHSTLSKDLIAKINDFELTGEALYIDAEYCAGMNKHRRPPEHNTGNLTIFQRYDAIKSAAAEAFREIARSEEVPWDQTTQLVLQIGAQLDTVKAPFILQCISAIRSTDQYLYTHCVNVSLLNGLMAKWLGKEAAEIEALINVGLLHDIGKLRIASSILDKPGKLTADEFDIVKKHSVYSQEILQKSGVSDQRLLAAVRGHHEQMNGEGYPDGLRMDQVPEYARITAISDIYDAMVAQRVYKAPASPFTVLEQFSKDRFSHLDIQLVNVFLTQMSVELVGKNVKLSNGAIAEVLYVDKEKFGFPIVRINGKAVMTNEALRPISLMAE